MSALVTGSRPAQVPEIGAALDETLDRLLEKLKVVFFTLGTAALGGPLLRTLRFGWAPAVSADIVIYALILATILVHRKLGARRAFGAVVGLIWVNGFTSLCSYGLASTGVLIMSATVTIGAVVFGKRVGWFATVSSLVAIAAVAVTSRLGLLPPLRDPLAFMSSAETWLTHAITLALYAVGMAVVVQSVHRRVIVALTELSERTLALESSERQYRLLADSTTDMVFVEDLEGNLTYVSPSALAITGYGPEELTRLEPLARFTVESWQRMREDLKYYRGIAESTGQDVVPLHSYEFLRKDRSTFAGEVRLSFLRDPAGRVYALQGTLRDISERLAAERAQRDLEEKMLATEKMRAVGQLAGGVAHDFNNQLAVILGYAELIARTSGLSERVRTAAERITESGTAAADLTRKLLTLARPAPGKSTMVDGTVLLHNVSAMLEHGLARNVKVHLDLRAVRHELCGDRGQLESALLNLALNARDAMPEGGTLTFSTRHRFVEVGEMPLLEITVRDTGTGMAPEVLKRATEPFFTTKPLGQGTGLGLSLVYSTVTAHGGRMQLKSELGVGTEVTILLPLAEPRGNVLGATFTTTASGRGRILLVDDDPAVCAVTTDLLRELGYLVTPFTTPREALDFGRNAKNEIDLVLTDLLMPDVNGIQICSALKAERTDLPVLVYSGRCDDQDELELRNAGASAILRKPLDLDGLSSAIRSALAR